MTMLKSAAASSPGGVRKMCFRNTDSSSNYTGSAAGGGEEKNRSTRQTRRPAPPTTDDTTSRRHLAAPPLYAGGLDDLDLDLDLDLDRDRDRDYSAPPAAASAAASAAAQDFLFDGVDESGREREGSRAWAAGLNALRSLDDDDDSMELGGPSSPYNDDGATRGRGAGGGQGGGSGGALHEELSMLGDLERQIQAITEGSSPSDPSSVAAQELQALVADVEILKVEKAQIEAKAQEFSNEAIDALAQAHLVGEQRVGEAEQREQQSAEEMKNQQVRVGGHGHACTVWGLVSVVQQ